MPPKMRILLWLACVSAPIAVLSAVTGEIGGARESTAAAARLGRDELGPDDVGLRYFASHDQRDRVNAEIARLRRLYPDFAPPTDLNGSWLSGVGDEQALWDLFGADRLSELRVAIASRRQDIPGWRPSSDLLLKLQRKEVSAKVTAYRRAGRWPDILALVEASGLSMADADADVLWTVAEAFARGKKSSKALNLYKSILNSNKDRQIRIATIQNAMAFLRTADVETLVAMSANGPYGATEFLPIANDLTRARIAAFLRDERPDEISQADLARFEDYARRSQDPDQLSLLAWRYYKRRDFRAALEWFELTMKNGGDGMVAHGLAQSLRALDRRREAEEIAFAWRETVINNRILFLDLLERELTREIPPYIEPQRLARYAKTTMEAASGEGAQALAWYAYNSCQFDVALSWFEKAVAWFPKEATVYGYALTLKRMRKERAFFELVNRYDGLFPRVVGLVFPDDVRHPPTPCEQGRRRMVESRRRAVRMGSYIVPAPADPIVGGLRGRAVAAQESGDAGRAAPRAPRPVPSDLLKRLRGKFPIAVAPENPLRFSPLLVDGAPRNYDGSFPSPSSIRLRPEPERRERPLVARRVPGVGRMPYERYGFNLLPSWNGFETPTWPPASAQIAPEGTQWATSSADPARAALRRDNHSPLAAVDRQGAPAGRKAAEFSYRAFYGAAPAGSPAQVVKPVSGHVQRR